jgi:hypothetical protein
MARSTCMVRAPRFKHITHVYRAHNIDNYLRAHNERDCLIFLAKTGKTNTLGTTTDIRLYGVHWHSTYSQE